VACAVACAALGWGAQASAQEMFVYRDITLPDFDEGVSRAQRFMLDETRSTSNLRAYVTYADGAVYMYTNYLTPGHGFPSKVVSTKGEVSVREMLAWAIHEDPSALTPEQLDAVAATYCRNATIYLDAAYLTQASSQGWPVYPARGMGVIDPNNYPRGAARAPYDDFWYVRAYHGVWVRPADAQLVGQMKTLALRRLRPDGHQWFAKPGRVAGTPAQPFGGADELSAEIDGSSSQLAVVLAPFAQGDEAMATTIADDNGVSLLWVDLEEVEALEEEPVDPCLPKPQDFEELADDEEWVEEVSEDPIDGGRAVREALEQAENHEQIIGYLARPLMARGYVMVLEESTQRPSASFTFAVYPAVDVDRGEPVGRVFLRVNEDAYGRLRAAEAPPEPEPAPTDEVAEEEPESRHFWPIVLSPLALLLAGVGFMVMKKRRDEAFQRRMKEME
jgi:hypothetical protein